MFSKSCFPIFKINFEIKNLKLLYTGVCRSPVLFRCSKVTLTMYDFNFSLCCCLQNNWRWFPSCSHFYCMLLKSATASEAALHFSKTVLIPHVMKAADLYEYGANWPTLSAAMSQRCETCRKLLWTLEVTTLSSYLFTHTLHHCRFRIMWLPQIFSYTPPFYHSPHLWLQMSQLSLIIC